MLIVPSRTSSFGTGKRESHDASAFYARRLRGDAALDGERDPSDAVIKSDLFAHSSESMPELPDDCAALMVTSPPYHVGKDYDSDTSFDDYLAMLNAVLKECYRVLEPGGRAVVNVANLGRRPYVNLAAEVSLMMEDLKFLPRGEVIWVKAKGASSSCAWGSWRSATNPTLRDVHEYCLCFSKERWDRARKGTSTISSAEFLESTLSVWELPSESARRVAHPAPFPVALPKRFIQLYTYEGDLVLDPFIGSGTTAVAAVESGRRYVGYDVDAGYLDTARERIRSASVDEAAP